jgi:hypothetical protein
MKVVILVITFCIVSTSFAAEVTTDCPAMNDSREKVVKTVKPVSKTRKGSSHQ